ncbi:MAG: DeoR/GlpR transcriptional regulator [Anaerolineales bacterium]|nr:DeoR/GlpR transcriptional regulator [Anaerolineales bacterium]
MRTTIFREERLQMIMNLLVDQKKVFVNDLAERFNLSETTIRTDMIELEERGLIIRTHGGAILPERSENRQFIFDKNILKLREELYAEEKKRISKATLELIHDGDSVMIDGGSTTHYVAEALKQKRGLTLITSSYYIVSTLIQIPDARIYLIGGLLHREFEDMIGEIATDGLNRFSPDHTIMGADGISLTQGLTTTEPSIAQNKRKMISVSKDLIIVADSSKFGKVALTRVADLSQVDTLVTDDMIPQECMDAFTDMNTRLIIA